jgi:hypothetical protein
VTATVIVTVLGLPASTASGVVGEAPTTAREASVSAVPGRPAADRKVRLTIKVTSCRGCRVSLFGDYRNGSHHWSRGAKLRYVGGPFLTSKTTVRVARKNTRGLLVGISDPKAVRVGAFPVAVLRYGSLRVGETVPSPHYDDTAYSCWAGTRKKKATLAFAVAHVDDVDMATGEEGYVALPFLERGVRTIGHSKATYGSVGLLTQETAGWCS